MRSNEHGVRRGTGLEKFWLFIAADDSKIVVSRLAPAIGGTFDRSKNGAIIGIEPHLMSRPVFPYGPSETLPAEVLTSTPPSGAGPVALGSAIAGVAAASALAYAVAPWAGIPVGAAVAAYGGWRALRRFLRVERLWAAGGHYVLTHDEDQHSFRTARAAVEFTQKHWPSLAATVGVEDPSPTLARALWELAAALVQRRALSGTQLELTQAMRSGLPAGSAAYADVESRLAQVEAAYQHLDADVDRDLGRLRALRNEVEVFVRQQAALRQSEAVIRKADQVMADVASTYRPASDDTANVTDRLAAVLGAYRELTEGRPI